LLLVLYIVSFNLTETVLTKYIYFVSKINVKYRYSSVQCYAMLIQKCLCYVGFLGEFTIMVTSGANK